MRCITIAKEILKKGQQVTFFVADEESAALVRDFTGNIEGIEIVILESDWQNLESELPVLKKELTTRDIKVLLVDSYKVTTKYFTELMTVCKIAYMDDLGKEAYPVDLIINYSGYFEQIGYDDLYKDTFNNSVRPVRMLLGLMYAPLREQFYREQSNKERSDNKLQDTDFSGTNIQQSDIREDKQSLNILLTAGGADMHGMLLGVSKELYRQGLLGVSNELNRQELLGVSNDFHQQGLLGVSNDSYRQELTGVPKAITIHAVVGSLVNNIEEIRSFADQHESVVIHEKVTDMAALMRRSDLAVAAAGTMLTECAAIGLPAIYYQVADNQKFNVEFWQRTGGMIFAGDVSSGDPDDKQAVLTCICDHIRSIISDNLRLATMRKALSGITDGKGAVRIAEELVKENHINPKPRGNKMKALAMITARGGSKRIPRKNIKSFNGKPIIAYSIEAALRSGAFEEVMVSTDDEEIASIAKEYGASVPFMRSEKTSNDFATTVDVIEEVIREYQVRGHEFDVAACIYPTAPFVTADRLSLAVKELSESDADSLIPVVRFSYPPQRAMEIKDGCLFFRQPEFLSSRSQDLTPHYHDAGQFYVFRVKSFRDMRGIMVGKILPMELSELEVQDIDSEVDWKLAELKYKLLHADKYKG